MDPRNRYSIQDIIGQGPTATIYRGWDAQMERSVALKIIKEIYFSLPEFVAYFSKQAQIALSLHHPHIVSVYDYGKMANTFFLAMELVEGTDLRHSFRMEQMFPPEKVIKFAREISHILAFTHNQGILHENIKPQNILLDHTGSVKLTDFGRGWGFFQFAAPEQIQGEPSTPATDIYALGGIMYLLVTGRCQFDGATPVQIAMQTLHDQPIPPSEINFYTPVALEKIILRCLEKTPEMRFSSGSQLSQALDSLGKE